MATIIREVVECKSAVSRVDRTTRLQGYRDSSQGKHLGALAATCYVEIVSSLGTHRDELDSEIHSRLDAAQNVLWRLRARRFPKPAFRLRSDFHDSGGKGPKELAAKYAKKLERFHLEQKIEKDCMLPPGSLFIHCPPIKPGMKLADALVVAAELKTVMRLRKVGGFENHGLTSFEIEIQAVEDMYEQIWRFHVFVDSTQMHKISIINHRLKKEVGVENDFLLQASLDDSRQERNEYDFLAEKSNSYPQNLFERLVGEVESRFKSVARYDSQETEQLVEQTIADTISAQRKPIEHPDDIPPGGSIPGSSIDPPSEPPVS